jgi:ATP/maltotriose-dependent transcriptional regulator MalT
VLAPAGHGKTTLLGQIASRFAGTVVWYRIDAADRDPQQLAGRIGRALGRVGLAGAECRSFEDVAAALDAAGRDMLLVFDDFHAVAGSAAEHGLARMIALAPPTLRVVLGARRVVGLDVPALRVYGAVHVVDANDLRFRSWEVERLFREVYHQPLPPEDAATLSQRTAGWAAGLAMFHLLTEGRPPAQRRRALADLSRGSRLVRSYLVREVLGDLPAELREFLRRTSSLGVLTGTLCDALLDAVGSQAVLEELEQRRLFTTTPDDGHQFRYHQVLLDRDPAGHLPAHRRARRRHHRRQRRGPGDVHRPRDRAAELRRLRAGGPDGPDRVPPDAEPHRLSAVCMACCKRCL